MFAAQWYCFATDSWVSYKGLSFATQEEAETFKAKMIKDYNPKKMTGFNPVNVRIWEV
ncbi:MAG: hypothetical protein WC623_22440 [Pedobacter sp.]|uniref:hypothetical protein n=1 Tax=Pedobacter sp. TaxID=1411316 RepID=UPI003563154C